MLPTPSTSHVPFDKIYEPAEDSFLLLDTLSSASETAFLKERFSESNDSVGSPLVLEVGTGSGVVLAFTAANSQSIFGRSDILVLGTDINSYACHATTQTIKDAVATTGAASFSLGAVNTDLVASIRPHSVDVLIFNPPYVPTEELPDREQHEKFNERDSNMTIDKFERDSHLLALSYAGGVDGMETTNRLLAELKSILRDRGVAYVLLCAQNRPERVKREIEEWGQNWKVISAGYSGKKGGWEKLQILRIWRNISPRS